MEVIDSHQQEDIIEVLKQQPIEVRERVEEVSVDMWGGFPCICTRSISERQASIRPISCDETS